MTLAGTTRYRPRPASWSNCCSWAASVLLICAWLSSPRSWTTSRCSALILAWSRDPAPRLEKKPATGCPTALATLSADPNSTPPNARSPRTGAAEEFLASRVIRASATARSTPRTRRVRRLSCTESPHSGRGRGHRVSAVSRRRGSATGFRHEYLAKRVKVLHALAGSQHHRIERVVGQVDGHAGLLAQALVEPAKEGAATGQSDAPVHDITGQFGRALVQGGLDRVDDERQRLLDGAADLLSGDHDGLRQPADQVPAADLGVGFLGGGVRRPKRHLDLFGGPLAEHQRVLLLTEGDDGLVQFVAADPDRLRGHDAAE